MVMAVLAQRLPVAPIPEQNRIAAMRNDMVNNGCGLQLAGFSAFGTERILFEEQRPGRAPFPVITAFSSIAAHAVCAVFGMFPAVDTLVAEIGTAGKPAWSFRFSGHTHLTVPADRDGYTPNLRYSDSSSPGQAP